MRGDFVMMSGGSKKNGFTLVEVLVVVSIMGILASMGVVSMSNAVDNARIRDVAMNTSAFLERIANESAKMSKVLCVKVVSNGNFQALTVLEDNCDDGEEFDHFILDPPAKFGCDIDNDVTLPNWTQNNAIFEPRIGLSSAPREGFLCIQYGSREIYGRIWKDPTKNMMSSQWKNGALSNWLSL